MLLYEKLFTTKRAQWRVASIIAIGMALIASGAHAAPAGYGVAFDDFGAVGGGNFTQPGLLFDGTTKSVGDTTITEQSRFLGDGRELLEWNISATAPLVTLTGGTTGWRIGFDNITWADTDLRQRDTFSLAFSVGGTYITAAPLTGSFFQETHSIDGHPIISLIPQHPSLPGLSSEIGASSGGFATLDGLMDIYIGDPALADQIDGIQISTIVSVIPEPGTALLLGLGLAGLSSARGRRA